MLKLKLEKLAIDTGKLITYKREYKASKLFRLMGGCSKVTLHYFKTHIKLDIWVKANNIFPGESNSSSEDANNYGTQNESPCLKLYILFMDNQTFEE